MTSLSLSPTPITRDSAIKIVRSPSLSSLYSNRDSLLELLSPLLDSSGEESTLASEGTGSSLQDSDLGEISPFPAMNPLSESNLRTQDRPCIYRSDQWYDRYQCLMTFRQRYGHCRVPRNYREDDLLAQWVKRQRYQYRLKRSGSHSTLTDERESMLDAIGFCWDSHQSNWETKFLELSQFVEENGNCRIPSRSEKYRQLATWVRGQRRQYKRFSMGVSSCMTLERYTKLSSIGFDWKISKNNGI